MQLADLVQSKNNNFTPSGNVALLSLDMAKAISKAVKFVSKDKSNLRPALSHVCFHIKYDTLTIVATNAEWAYISEPFNIGLDKTFPEHKYLVTVAEARSIAKAIRANKTMYLHTGTMKQFVGVQNKETIPCIKVYKKDYEILCCPKSEMRYPEYDRYIPEYTEALTVGTFNLKSAINEAIAKFDFGGEMNRSVYGNVTKHNPITGEVTGSKNYPIKLECTPSGYHISIEHSDRPRNTKAFFRKLVRYEAEGENSWALYLNAKLVQEILKLIPDSVNTFIATTGKNDNGIVIAPEGSREKFLLMPLQL